MSDQPTFQPPVSGQAASQQGAGEQPPTVPGTFPGSAPSVYPPPPEFYTAENFPPPQPLPPLPQAAPVAYAQYPQYPQYAQPGSYYGAPGYGAPPMPQEQGSGLAVAGLILGIISIPAALIAICGFACGVVGVILSTRGRRSLEHRTMANYGLILSIVGLVLSVASSAAGIYIAATHPGLFGTP